MKKIFIFLGVVFLSMTLVSCKEETKYEKYENSDKLNEMLLNKRYDVYASIIYPNTMYIDMILEGKKIYWTYLGDDIKDYYICGYFDKSIKEKIANIEVVADRITEYSILGKDDYILAWSTAVRENVISNEEYLINWYKIPKNEEVPESINDKFLVSVLESVNVIYECLEDDEKFETEIVFENYDFYTSKYEKRYDREEMLKKECMQMLSVDSVNNLKDGFTLVENYYGITGLVVKYFDEIPCITFGHYTVYHDEDLKEKLEYFGNENKPYFKMDDVIKLLGR